MDIENRVREIEARKLLAEKALERLQESLRRQEEMHKRDLAHTAMAKALLGVKENRRLTWQGLADLLDNCSSWEMLRSLAFLRAYASARHFNKIRSILIEKLNDSEKPLGDIPTFYGEKL